MLRDRGGRRVGAYQFVYDITERQRDQERLKHAEAALRQAQKMESLGQLTGGVAHDFNNLLAVFASGLQLLERNPNPSPRVFEAMRRAVARGTGLTRHLLTFSRRQPVNPESIDIAVHLRGMRALLDGSLGGHIHVDMPFAADLWPVEVDAGEMELAILNLCVNARDPMPGGGVITIAAQNVRGAAVGGDGTQKDVVQLSVADTGSGMTPEVLASSSRSSPPRTSARARASVCRRSTASPISRAAASRSTATSAPAPRRPCCCHGRYANPQTLKAALTPRVLDPHVNTLNGAATCCSSRTTRKCRRSRASW